MLRRGGADGFVVEDLFFGLAIISLINGICRILSGYNVANTEIYKCKDFNLLYE